MSSGVIGYMVAGRETVIPSETFVFTSPPGVKDHSNTEARRMERVLIIIRR
jgi:hypothetical protein